MAIFTAMLQQFGLAKESVRGTAEAAPSKWYPSRGVPELDFMLEHLEDEGLRGSVEMYPPVAGMKVGEANIPFVADAQMLGEAFYSLLGTVNSVQQGATAAYKHTFTLNPTTQKPSYTLFIDRSMNVLKHPLGVCKSIEFVSPVDGLIEVNTNWMFKDEESGSIGSPSYPTQRYLAFQHVDFQIAGASNTKVKEFNLTLDNQAFALRTLNQSQLPEDIITAQKFMVEGGFTIYFEDSTERDKFLANTASALRMTITGQQIESPYNYEVDINVYAAHYKAFPFREDEGLLAAQVEFQGYYSASDTKQIQVDVTNTDTSY